MKDDWKIWAVILAIATVYAAFAGPVMDVVIEIFLEATR